MTGQAVESPDDAINVWDFERAAHATNLAQHWDYLHMGVDDYETRRANREGFQRLMLRPRRLGGEALAEIDTSTELYGRRWASPLFLCPVASLEAYHTQGESGAARAARPRDILQMQSHQSSQSYAAIAEARGEPHWFQIYTTPDWNVNQRVIDRVAGAGCPALVWTIDLLGGSNRELQRRTLAGEGYSSVLCQSCHQHHPDYLRPMRAGLEGPEGPRYPYTWDYIKRLKDASDMKLILKGIMTAEGAEQAIEHGADGIFVSNHGGRAVNSMWSSIDSLPEVVNAVRGRVPVFIDSGVRRGTDIFKALALGADAVGIGRPYVWGLGAFGEDGVGKVIDLILAELRIAMRQTRTTSTDQITSPLRHGGQEPHHDARQPVRLRAVVSSTRAPGPLGRGRAPLGRGRGRAPQWNSEDLKNAGRLSHTLPAPARDRRCRGSCTAGRVAGGGATVHRRLHRVRHVDRQGLDLLGEWHGAGDTGIVRAGARLRRRGAIGDAHRAGGRLRVPRRDDDRASHGRDEAGRVFAAITFRLDGYEASGAGAEASGALTIQGVTRPVRFPISLTPSGAGVAIAGEVALDMTEYGVEPPVVLLGLLRVRPEIRIQFEGLVVP